MEISKSKLIFRSPAGHEIHRQNGTIFINHVREMLAFSTSQLNGGINKIQHSFNHQLDHWVETAEDLPGGNLKNYLEYNAKKLGLDCKRATGLITSASMDNASIVQQHYREASLFVLVTAGIDVNAVRAGEPATYDEISYGRFVPIGGTINIILVLEFALPIECLARTAIVVTEAKTAALQDLNVKSCFSKGGATGTGTDGLIVACNVDGEYSFSDVGTQSKLGELICTTVIRGVTEALIKDNCRRL